MQQMLVCFVCKRTSGESPSASVKAYHKLSLSKTTSGLCCSPRLQLPRSHGSHTENATEKRHFKATLAQKVSFHSLTHIEKHVVSERRQWLDLNELQRNLRNIFHYIVTLSMDRRKKEEQLVSLNTEVEIFGVTKKHVSLECWKKLNRRCSLTPSAGLVDWNCKVLSANLSLCVPTTSERMPPGMLTPPCGSVSSSFLPTNAHSSIMRFNRRGENNYPVMMKASVILLWLTYQAKKIVTFVFSPQRTLFLASQKLSHKDDRNEREKGKKANAYGSLVLLASSAVPSGHWGTHEALKGDREDQPVGKVKWKERMLLPPSHLFCNNEPKTDDKQLPPFLCHLVLHIKSLMGSWQPFTWLLNSSYPFLRNHSRMYDLQLKIELLKS